MQDFEIKIANTKEILSKLNAQNLSLKEGLELYKKGIDELKTAQALLEQATLTYNEIKASSLEASDHATTESLSPNTSNKPKSTNPTPNLLDNTNI